MSHSAAADLKSGKYYESHIKCDFLDYLRTARTIDARTVIASEYVLGTTGRRADLALLNGSRLIGIEVKSKFDTLSRLKDQLEVYTACFDDVIVVLDERHIDEGLRMASEQIAVYEVGHNNEITLRRAASIKPRVNSELRLQMLTIQELKKLTGYDARALVKKRLLLEQAATLPEHVISNTIADAFRQAFSDTTADFWRHVKRKRVNLEALGRLSRFAQQRTILRQRQDDRARFWDTWRQNASTAFEESAA